MSEAKEDFKVILSVAQTNQPGTYLGTRPYLEVCHLVEMLKTCVVKYEGDSKEENHRL